MRHVIAFLVGNIVSEPSAAAKYGLLFRALERTYGPICKHDLTLRKLDRLWNGLLSFHPDQRLWKERYFKSPGAFLSRSHRASRIIDAQHPPVDLILQVAALFDAGWGQPQAPVVMYTDYTASLSANDPYRFRSPFSAKELRRRIDYERQAYLHAHHIFTRSRLVRRDIVDRYRDSRRACQRGGRRCKPSGVARLGGAILDPAARDPVCWLGLRAQRRRPVAPCFCHDPPGVP